MIKIIIVIMLFPTLSLSNDKIMVMKDDKIIAPKDGFFLSNDALNKIINDYEYRIAILEAKMIKEKKILNEKNNYIERKCMIEKKALKDQIAANALMCDLKDKQGNTMSYIPALTCGVMGILFTINMLK